MYFFLKRFFDIIFSILILIFFSPILLLISLIILIVDRHNPFFLQKRPGFKERFFYIIKFRTMMKDNSNIEYTDTTSQRLTKFGAFLRSSSLDEIPTLINILLGQMSFVGPRPLLVEYLDIYSDEQKKRHSVLPGLTGLAQIKGRNNIKWEDRFNYDIYYVKNKSIFFDLKILLVTVKKVIIRDGINHTKNVTMPLFKGIKGK